MSAPGSDDRAGGIYVHFAYCARRCAYCDFALATPKAVPAARYTDALIAELAAKAPLLPGPARTLYVGGGTPSLWPPAELARFLAAARTSPGLAPDAELTLEANPEDLVAPGDPWLDAVLALGVNRVSLGVQSLEPATLAALGRVHDVDAALAASASLAAAHRAGRLASWSIDLMYGLPGQSLDAWRAELAAVVERFDPPHLSLYALTVEPRTVLGLAVRKGRRDAPDDALQADMMFAARDLLAARGYTHYEVSSFAREGHVARHNVGGRRATNEGRPARYLERIAEHGDATVEAEVPDADTLAFERVLVGLRRLDIGLARGDVAARFDPVVAAEVAAGRLVASDGRVRLTDLGLRFMDDVLLAFVP